MKLVDSKMPGWQKALFFLGLALAYFIYVNMTGDESWLLSTDEKERRRAYTIAQQYINRTYAPPSPARFPPFEEIAIKRLGEQEFLIEGWVAEPDEKGEPQRFDYTIQLLKHNARWQAPMLQFKDLAFERQEAPVNPSGDGE